MTKLSRRLPALLLLTSTLACARSYRPPALTEPHATVTVVVGYHGRLGERLEQHARLDGQELELPPPDGTGLAKREVVVPAKPLRWEVAVRWYHVEKRPQMQTSYVPRSMPCGGDGKSVCTTMVPSMQQVEVATPVDDAACTRALDLVPESGATYVVRYDLTGKDQCTFVCLRHRPRPGGGIDSGPC